MKEQEPKPIFDNKQKEKQFHRVGLELDDEQLSQVPNPQVKEKAKNKPLKLGSFWTDEY
jgi:hypothetical protein